MATREELIKQLGEELNVLLASSRVLMTASAEAFDPELQPAAYQVALGLSLLDGANATQLAQRLEMDKSAISRLTRSLIDKGLLTSFTDPKDARSILYYLTSKGAERIKAAAALKASAFYLKLEGWSEDEIAQLANLLGKFTR